MIWAFPAAAVLLMAAGVLIYRRGLADGRAVTLNGALPPLLAPKTRADSLTAAQSADAQLLMDIDAYK